MDDASRTLPLATGPARADDPPSRPDEDALAREVKRLRIALDAAELGTWHHDMVTGIVVLDARAQAHYGLKRAELPIAAVNARMHPDDRARVTAERGRVLGPEGVERFRTEYRVVDDDGTTRLLLVDIRVEFAGASGARRAVFGYGTSRDVTAQRAAERQLSGQQLLLREVGEIAHVGGWEFDPATGAGTWTEETYRIHGLTGPPDDASVGLDRFAGDARRRIEAALHDAATAGTPYDLELPFTACDGTQKWVRAVCRPVVADGRVVRLRGTLQDITGHKLSELALGRFIQASPVVVYALAIESDGLRLVWTGGDIERLTGWAPDEVSAGGWWRDSIHPEDWPRVEKSSPVPYDLEHVSLEFRVRRKDGEYRWVRDERRLLRDAAGHPSEVVGSWSDVTDRMSLEAQLRQAQKMEAIGRLAGGIAHDFNNLLTVIMGNGELLATALATPEDAHMLQEIMQASERASMLTRQLLAFSRKQMLQPVVLGVNDEMVRLDAMLHRILGEDIEIRCRFDPDAGHIRVDPGQFGQVVLNLAVNARDAMPRGGTLMLITDGLDSLDVIDSSGSGPGPAAAQAPHGYARITIADTGTGMTPDVQAHIFEPFFTTKPAGQGTGLGLATVFGIVKQSGGSVDVHSEAGVGSRFAVYFPRTAPTAAARADAPAEPGGHETILLVEDDAAVRGIASRVLTRKGYRVIERAGPQAALDGLSIQDIDLLVTDIVMPGMSGRELATTLRTERPGLRVLFMSGYVRDALERQGLGTEGEAFLHKPFTAAALVAHVRRTLDAPLP